MSAKHKKYQIRDAQTGCEIKIPQPPRKLSSYQVYMKAEHPTIASQNPGMSQPELLSAVATRWKTMDSSDKELYERLAERENRKHFEEWELRKHEREFERMTAARQLGLALSTPWEELYETVKRRNGASLGTSADSKVPTKDRARTAAPKIERQSSTSSILSRQGSGSSFTSGQPAKGGGQLVAKRDAKQKSEDWDACWRSTIRRKAVVKALDAIFALADEEDNFSSFGNDIIQCFYDIACVTTDPVRGRALMYVEQLAQRWRHSVLARGWRTPGSMPTPQNIVDTIIGLYCMERVGVSSARLKADVCRVVGELSPKPAAIPSQAHVATDSGVNLEATDSGANVEATDSGANVEATDSGANVEATDSGANVEATDSGANVEATGSGANVEATDSGANVEATDSGANEEATPQLCENDGQAAIEQALDTRPADNENGDRLEYSAADYLGWDPKGGGPPDACDDVLSGQATSKYRSMCNALIYSFYAERVGVDIGCRYADVLRWLEELRPYKGPRDIQVWDDFVDQCYLVTHVVFTINNWGELALEPGLLPHEYLFIREHMCIAIRQRDVHLVGEYVECLRCFGATDADPLVQLGIAFLLGTQSEESGRWDETEDAYTSYHATMVAAQALLAHTFRGYGPGISSALPVLETWLQADKVILAARTSSAKKNPASDADKGDAEASASPDEIVRNFTREKIAPPPDSLKKKAPLQPALPSIPAKRPKLSDEVSPPTKLDLVTIEGNLKQSANNGDWNVVSGLLARLDAANVVYQDLTDTSIGKTVAQLKKVDNAGITSAAKKLVAKWKRLVRAN